MNKKKAVVLSSGGLDSSTAIAWAINCDDYDEVVTLSIYYGQRHQIEVDCANAIANFYNLRHYECNLEEVFKFSNCNLLAKNENTIPEKSYASQVNENGNGRVSTYVPFRNGTMMSVAAAIADSLFEGSKVDIIYGAHRDDAANEAYADCSPEFNEAMNKAINIGTYSNISTVAPFINMNKAEIVKLGSQLNVPYILTYSCYNGGEKQCGKCATCIDRKAAFEANGLIDPRGYAEETDVKR